MFSLDENIQFYVHNGFVDMRNGIQGLYSMICSKMESKPFITGSTAFIFFGKDRRSVKIIRYDSGGILLYHKRLEQGSFEIPEFDTESDSIEMDFQTFEFIIRGVMLDSVKYRKRYKPIV